MAYAWGYENYADDWCQGGGQDIPEEIERLVVHAVKELFHDVPAKNDVERALKVRQAIHVISDTYKTKLCSDIRPNWQDPAFRCAYVYLYFLKHSSLVCDLLHTLLHPMMAENWESYIRVCCAGGGPGSEIVGVMMYLLNMNYTPFIECNVMDLNPSWELAWKIIQKHIPTEPKVKVTYTPFDMADEASWLWRDVEAAVSTADLVTFVKSLSAVQTFIAGHRIGTGAIPAVLRALKPGATVLFIDNMRDDSNLIFLHMTRDEGLHLVQEWHDESYSRPSTKFVEAMKHFEDMFEYRPLRGCKVSAFLFRKPMCQPRHPTLHWTLTNEVTHQLPSPNPEIEWIPPYNYNDKYHWTNPTTDMPCPKLNHPMLYWSPFGGEVREWRPDPQYRPTFNDHIWNAPPHIIQKRPSHGKRKNRRISPFQRRLKKASPKKKGNRIPVLSGVRRRESGGDGVISPYPCDSSLGSSSGETSAELDFSVDCPWWSVISQ